MSVDITAATRPETSAFTANLRSIHQIVTGLRHCPAQSIMELSIWTTTTDTTRLGRLALGFTVGFLALAGALTGLALAAPSPDQEEEIEIASFELAEEPEPAEDEPEPEPEELEALKDIVERSGPRLASLKPPVEIPDDNPKEADPSDQSAGDGFDPYAATGGKGRVRSAKGTGKDRGEKKVDVGPVKHASPPPPKPQGPKRVDEQTTPPRPISMPYPIHPEALKAQGIEGVVVMKYVVDEQGNVPTAKPILGPMALAKVCWESMRNWKFQPAKDKDGNPISVTQTARFTFKIETD